MDRLSPLDAAFLQMEDEDPNASLAIGSLALAEGPAPTQKEFTAAFTRLLPLIPRYRQRVQRVPLDLGPPIWVDDAHFEPTRHLHRIAAPAPGDETTLCDLVAMLMAPRLDRDRPLWECWLIEGLERGRWAILSKVHHCMTDGVAGNALHEVLFSDHPPPVPPAEPEPAPGTVRLLVGSLYGLLTSPLELARFLTGVVTEPGRLVRRMADAARGLGTMATALVPVAPSSLSGPIGRERRYELAHASLSHIVAIAHAFGVTVNDVVLAAISGAFREVLLDRGEEPGQDTLRTLVPVSVRAKAAKTIMDNRISLMVPLLPVEEPDAVSRLSAVHRRITDIKARKESEAGVAVTTCARHAPFAPIAWAVRAAAKLPQRSIATIATNIAGPRHELSVLGRRIVDLYPYVPIALRLRTGIAVLSYADRLSFGITADLDTAAKARFLADAIEHDLATLAEAARTVQADRGPAK